MSAPLAVMVCRVTVSNWFVAGSESVAPSWPVPVVADVIWPFAAVAVSMYCVAPRPAFQVNAVLPPAIFAPGGGVRMLAAAGTVTVSGAEPYCETPPAIPVMLVTYAPSGVLEAVLIVRVADPPA